MGGGCYKAKNLTISKEDVLRAINEQYINDTIQTDRNSIERATLNQTSESAVKPSKPFKGNKVVHLDSATNNSAASTGMTTQPMKTTLFTAEDELTLNGQARWI